MAGRLTLARAAAAGVDSVLVADAPLNESARLERAAAEVAGADVPSWAQAASSRAQVAARTDASL